MNVRPELGDSPGPSFGTGYDQPGTRGCRGVISFRNATRRVVGFSLPLHKRRSSPLLAHPSHQDVKVKRWDSDESSRISFDSIEFQYTNEISMIDACPRFDHFIFEVAGPRGMFSDPQMSVRKQFGRGPFHCSPDEDYVFHLDDQMSIAGQRKTMFEPWMPHAETPMPSTAERKRDLRASASTYSHWRRECSPPSRKFRQRQAILRKA